MVQVSRSDEPVPALLSANPSPPNLVPRPTRNQHPPMRSHRKALCEGLRAAQPGQLHQLLLAVCTVQRTAPGPGRTRPPRT